MYQMARLTALAQKHVDLEIELVQAATIQLESGRTQGVEEKRLDAAIHYIDDEIEVTKSLIIEEVGDLTKMGIDIATGAAESMEQTLREAADNEEE